MKTILSDFCIIISYPPPILRGLAVCTFVFLSMLNRLLYNCVCVCARTRLCLRACARVVKLVFTNLECDMVIIIFVSVVVFCRYC